jgi:hypothetical protein
MDIRYNINRIDVLLQDKFEDVAVKENSSPKFGNFFEISVKQDREVRMIIPYKNIDGKQNFEFLYYSNPLNENSELIPRNTTIESVSEAVDDILSKNRFSEEYLKN